MQCPVRERIRKRQNRELTSESLAFKTAEWDHDPRDECSLQMLKNNEKKTFSDAAPQKGCSCAANYF